MEISKMIIEVVQPGNTMGTTKEYETLELTLEAQLGDFSKKEDRFWVIRTDGWSMDSIEELKTLFGKVENIFDDHDSSIY